MTRTSFEEAKRLANQRAQAARRAHTGRTGPKNQRKANLGKHWETCIAKMHKVYQRQGLADIQKIDNPAQPLEPPRKKYPSEVARFGGKGMVMLARPETGRHVDFVGVLKGGKAVRLEAKSARVDRIALDAVKPHQAARLGYCDKLGGFAAVLVALPSGLWVVPWLHWTPAKASSGKNKKSLNPADLDERGARIAGAEEASALLAGATTGVDWLGVARRKGWI